MQTFISYKREDQPFAEQLQLLLQTWGHTAWLDVRDIAEGANWDDEIHKGLKSSQVVIGVLTPHSVRSPNVLDEWGWALDNQRRLFLLWKDEVPSEDIPPRYTRIQRIDLRRDPARIERLRAALASPTLTVPDEDARAVVEGARQAHPGVAGSTRTRDERRAQPERSRRATGESSRARLLGKVYDDWINNVLEPGLAGRAFDLGLSMRSDAVLRHADFGDYTLTTSASIAEIFDDLGRELLILGAPGAGKSVLMLQLAKTLIARAQADPLEPVPVVFNLSSWAQTQAALDVWMIEELRTQYQVSRRLARRWIDDEALMPLFDGLDEVAVEQREACVEAINTFIERYRTVKLVVCSRIGDYELLTRRLRLRAAILLDALTAEQIEAQLAADPELAGLRAALERSAVVRQMSVVPFLLNTLVYTYRGAKASELLFSDDFETAKRELFDQFVKRRYSRETLALGGEPPYSLAQVRHWLTLMARTMVYEARSVFLIERLDAGVFVSMRTPPTPAALTLDTVGATAAPAVTAGSTARALFWRFRLWVVAVFVGLGLATFTPILANYPLRSAEQIHPTLLAMVSSSVDTDLRWSFALAAVIIGVALGLVHGVWNLSKPIIVYERLRMSWQRFALSVGLGLAVSLVLLLAFGAGMTGNVAGFAAEWGSQFLAFGLTGGVMFGLVYALEGRDGVEGGTVVNRGMWQSLSTALYAGTMASLLAVYLSFFVVLLWIWLYRFSSVAPMLLVDGAATLRTSADSLWYWVTGLLLVPLLLGIAAVDFPFNHSMALGGAAVIKHVILRVMLARRGDAPWNYARLLNFTSAVGLTRRVGGGYIFIHRMLLEYFAAQAVEERSR